MILFTLSFACLVLMASGCKLQSKREREEQALAAQQARDAEKTAAQEAKENSKQSTNQAKLEALESSRINNAFKDLDDRVAIYNAIVGEYEGRYRALDGHEIAITMTVVINNLPMELRTHRPRQESEILAMTEALSFDASIDEYWAANDSAKKTKLMNCHATAVKPDLSSGQLRLTCASGTNGPSRYYHLGIDSPDKDFEATDDAAILNQRARHTANDLVGGKIRSIDAMSIRIQTAYVDFGGKLWRKKKSGSAVQPTPGR